jgi:hypothetical protein
MREKSEEKWEPYEASSVVNPVMGTFSCPERTNSLATTNQADFTPARHNTFDWVGSTHINKSK